MESDLIKTSDDLTPAGIRQKHMLELLDKCKAVLGDKKADYGINNFVEAAEFLRLMTNKIISPMDTAYVLMGIKLSRIKTLRKQGLPPVNESLRDSIVDTVNYFVLETRERERYEQEQKTKDETGKASSSAGVHEP
ncbi:MAG: hypothetical protein ACXABY_12270 [Candidatus Thorarchaeota archaeon]